MDRRRSLRVLEFIVGALLLFPVSSEGQRYSHGINRPGGDYRSFDLVQADPRMCQLACERDGPCRSWTYVHSGVQGPSARCWLKNSVPVPVENKCCISGVDRNAGEVYQEATDRPGMNYHAFEMDRAEPALCEAACVAQGLMVCRAWTYFAPGNQGPRARCWLKGGVPGPVPAACCVSGVPQRR